MLAFRKPFHPSIPSLVPTIPVYTPNGLTPAFLMLHPTSTTECICIYAYQVM